MEEPQLPTPESAWCIVANVVMERPYGVGGAEIRSGTKHFAPGAKVHVLNVLKSSWIPGIEDVTVVGRHRKSHRYIELTMRVKHLTNWRIETIYSLFIVRRLRERGNLCGTPPDELASDVG